MFIKSLFPFSSPQSHLQLMWLTEESSVIGRPSILRVREQQQQHPDICGVPLNPSTECPERWGLSNLRRTSGEQGESWDTRLGGSLNIRTAEKKLCLSEVRAKPQARSTFSHFARTPTVQTRWRLVFTYTHHLVLSVRAFFSFWVPEKMP